MHKILIFFLFLLSVNTVSAASAFDSTKDLPVAYQGRFRSLESTSRLWLYDVYHRQQLKKIDLTAFKTENPSALDLLWRVHFFGHTVLKDVPLFWVHFAQVKTLLGLDPTQDRFSYSQLNHALYDNQETNLAVMRLLIADEFAHTYHPSANRAKNRKIELQGLTPGLWTLLQEGKIIIVKAPPTPPWNFLFSGLVVSDHGDELVAKLQSHKQPAAEEVLRLFQSMHTFTNYEGSQIESERHFEEAVHELEHQGYKPTEMAHLLENRIPLYSRLQSSGTTLKMLPSRLHPGEWLSLHAFKVRVYDPKQSAIVPAANFTSFTDDQFQNLRKAYLALEASVRHGTKEELDTQVASFVNEMTESYATLAGTSYKEAAGKKLLYPSFWRLKAETYYYQIPLIGMAIFAYALSLILFLTAYTLISRTLNRLGMTVLVIGFIIHTFVLALRCYVLHRPPVSNMFETVVYVPWIALIIGLTFYLFSKTRVILIASCFASLALLILLELTHVDARMENVQAVLDSQYWLIVHVLMVVGSYGAFAVCGVLGHFYLVKFLYPNKDETSKHSIAQGTLHTMYVGVALLIPGTILGGVWAAESWGRFWDWDPKESWAFISACVYLLVIHAYTFKKIGDFGLAIGAVSGLMAISFTWYGVNYILGTGLHSYGFGKGGEGYYFLYLGAEVVFLMIVAYLKFRVRKEITPQS